MNNTQVIPVIGADVKPQDRLKILMEHQPEELKALGLRQLPVDVRAARINEWLTGRKLRPLAGIAGATEIVDILYVEERNPGFFRDVAFVHRLPNGVEFFIPTRFNANGIVSDGSVCVVVINGRLAAVYEWRHCIGQYLWGSPRGFSQDLAKAGESGDYGSVPLSGLPWGGMPKELKEEVTATGQIERVIHLGRMFENSGTSNIAPDYFMVFVSVPEATHGKIEGTEGLKVELLSWEEVIAGIGVRFRDNHTITALCLALKAINELKKL